MSRRPPSVLAFVAAGMFAATGVSAAAPANEGSDRGRPTGIEIREVGRYTALGAEFGGGGAEIVAHDPGTQRLFIANGSEGTLDVVDIADPASPTLVEQVDLAAFGTGITGVGAGRGLVGVAVQPADVQEQRGRAVFVDPGSLEVVADVEVGFGPDALLFSPNGRHAVVANEAEPNDEYTIDPPGTVSIIDTRRFSVTEVTFTQFDGGGLDESVRIFGPGATVSQDLEPENIAFSANSRTAWVSLQENNALARIDLRSGEIEDVFGLGLKDHSLERNALDASNRDDAINIRPWPVLGIRQPDALATVRSSGETFVLTANEGDARDYAGFSEEARVAEVELCAEEYPDAAELQREANLGRLNITTVEGFDEARNCFEQLHSYGARSFSVYTGDGTLVYDSGSDFEDVTAEVLGRNGFNANNDEPGAKSFDSRSDDKGPEPEGIATGNAFGRDYAFIGLERVGGFMTYDVTDPTAPTFVAYTTGRDFDAATAEESVDLGPEGVIFVSQQDSPTRRPLVVLAHEVTGTTTIYELDRARR